MKVLNWITKEPFYRLMIGNMAVLLVITQAEGKAFWLGGIALILDLFFVCYAKFIKR